MRPQKSPWGVQKAPSGTPSFLATILDKMAEMSIPKEVALEAEVQDLRKRLADREARLREINDTMRTHSGRITVRSGTRYVLDLIKWHSDLKQPSPQWLETRLPPRRKVKEHQ